MINEDMKLVVVSEEDAEDRDKWRQMIRSGDPRREQLQEEDSILSKWCSRIVV